MHLFNCLIYKEIFFNTMANISSYFIPFLLLLLLLTAISQSHQNISLGSSLVALDDNKSSWLSPSGEFAFGFREYMHDSFLLAIWFNNITEKTIVWSLNVKNTIQRGSKLKLTKQGQLVLTGPVLIDPISNNMWEADTGGSRAAYAAMLNNGNFVLAGEDSSSLWESFDEPTDTILPTQTLGRGRKLIARYSDLNYSNGRFEFVLYSDGNFGLYTTDFPLDSVNVAYWLSQTVGRGFQLIFNQSGEIYLTAKDGSVLKMLSANAPSTEDFYHRAVLEYDGVFTHYVYPKSSSPDAAGWSMAWSPLSFIPDNICTSFGEGRGSGACGFNSYCSLGNDHRPNCKCPPGYIFLDPKDVMKGCKQKFVSQTFEEESSNEASQFYFEEKENMDWPYSDYAYFHGVSEDWCRKACLSDCFCAVVVFRNADCWKKKTPLSSGRLDPSTGGKTLIKVRKDDSTLKPDDDHSAMIIIGSLLLSSSVSLNFVLLTATVLAVFHFGYFKPKHHHFDENMPEVNLQSFTYNELEKATNKFKEELGKGGFATVYKGILPFDSKTYIAVKHLDKMLRENEKEFKAEVSAIGRSNHRNLVRLLGFCNEGEHRLLVYEFISNGNLANFLFRNMRPSWYMRIKIAFGIARGLFYLHEECNAQIIHCDIKPQNILLDDSFTARISDFGVAKLMKADQTRTTTAMRGTKGYVAPEWFKNLPITVKVDVYSFGILLLELICCRKNFELEVDDENQMVLSDWAYDCYTEGKVQLLVENDEEAMHDMKRVVKFVMVAIWCIQEDPSLRPTMKKVSQMLEGIVEVSAPPDPSSFISSIDSF